MEANITKGLLYLNSLDSCDASRGREMIVDMTNTVAQNIYDRLSAI